jgi:hypothetical protein
MPCLLPCHQFSVNAVAVYGIEYEDGAVSALAVSQALLRVGRPTQAAMPYPCAHALGSVDDVVVRAQVEVAVADRDRDVVTAVAMRADVVEECECGVVVAHHSVQGSLDREVSTAAQNFFGVIPKRL